MYDLKKYKKFAKIQLKERWKVPVLVTLVITLILKLFSIPDIIELFSSGKIPASLQEIQNIIDAGPMDFLNTYIFAPDDRNPVILISLFILESFASFVFLLASLNVFITMSKSPQPVSFNLFIEGLNNWAQAIIAGLLQIFYVCIWAFISIPVIFIFSLLFTILRIDPNSTIVLVFSYFIITLCYIPCFIKLLSYSQLFYLLAEYPDLSPKKALSISVLITNGYKKDLFLTLLSFIGWFLLSYVTFGISNLWVTPYYRMTRVNIFHALMKNALEDHIITPEDLA